MQFALRKPMLSFKILIKLRNNSEVVSYLCDVRNMFKYTIAL